MNYGGGLENETMLATSSCPLWILDEEKWFHVRIVRIVRSKAPTEINLTGENGYRSEIYIWDTIKVSRTWDGQLSRELPQ